MAIFRIDKFSGIRDEIVASDPSSLESCINFDLTDDNKLRRRFGIGYFDSNYGYVNVVAEPAASSPILKIINAGTHSYDSGGGVYKSLDEILVFRKDGKIALLRQDGWKWVKSLGGFHYWDSATYGSIKSYTITKFRDLYLISANKDISTPQDVSLPQTVIMYKQATTGNYVFVSAGLQEVATISSFVPQATGALGPFSWFWHRQFDFTTFDGITYQITGSTSSSGVLNNYYSSATNLTGLVTATINTPNVPTQLLHYPPLGSTNTLKVFRTASAGASHSLVHDIQITSPTTSITTSTPVVGASLSTPLYIDSGEVPDNIAPVNLTRAATTITDNGVGWALDYKNKLLRQSKPGAIYSWPLQFEQGLKNDIKCIASVGHYPILFSETSIDRCEGFLDSKGFGFTDIKSVSTQVGTKFQDAIVKVNSKLYFISSNGVYVTDGFTVEPLSTSINSILDIMTVFPNEIRGHFDSHENKIYWVSSVDYVLVYHLNANVPGFTVYKTSQGIFSSVGSFLDNDEVGNPRARSNKGKRLLVGTTNSFLGFLKNESDAFNTCDTITLSNTGVENPYFSEPISHEFLTNPIDLNSTFATKWISKVAFSFKKFSYNLAMGFSSKNNRANIFKLELLNYTDSLINNFKLVKRHFPRKKLRATYKQVGVNVEYTTIADQTLNKHFIVKPLPSSVEFHYESGTFPANYDTNYGGYDIDFSFSYPSGKVTGVKILSTGVYTSTASSVIPTVSYTSFNERIRKIFKDSQGKMYYVGDYSSIAPYYLNLTYRPNENEAYIKSSMQVLNITSFGYGNGITVLISSQVLSGPINYILVSLDDGQTWTRYNTGQYNQWRSVCFGNGKFVAVSQQTSTQLSMYSTDGITWSSSATGLTQVWSSVCYGNGIYVAVASSGTANYRVKTSVDGINWVQRYSPSLQWENVIFANGVFVAVGQSGTDRIMVSINGIDWFLKSYVGESLLFTSVAYGNGRFVAVGSGSTGFSVYSTDNGNTWNFVTATPPMSIGRVTFHNGKFYYYSLDGFSGVPSIYTSLDGITWTNVPTEKGYGMDYAVSTATSLVGVRVSGNIPQISNLARTDAKGFIDTQFSLNSFDVINTTSCTDIAEFPSGNLMLLRGGFGSSRLFLLNSDGTKNTTFPDPPMFSSNQFNAQAFGVLVVGNSLFVWGAFSTYLGVSCRRLVKLSETGVLDTTFNTNLASVDPSLSSNSPMEVIYNPGTGLLHIRFGGMSGGGPELTACDLNGNYQAAWRYSCNYGFLGMAAASHINNGLFVVGDFTTIGATSCPQVALLKGSGTIDSAFNTNLGTGAGGNRVSGVLIHDNAVYICGGYTSFNGQSTRGFTKLTLSGIQYNEFNVGQLASFPQSCNGFERITIDNSSKIQVFGTTFTWTDTYTTANFTSYPMNNIINFAVLEPSDGSISMSTRIIYSKLFGFVPDTWKVSGYPKNTSFLIDSIEYTYEEMGNGYKDAKEDGGLD